jgi:hypothetical protein
VTHTELAEKVSIRDASMLCYIETAGGGDSDNAWQGMLDIEKDTARRIIDALAVAIDGKASSADAPRCGIEMHGTYFRPDVWVAGALVKKGYLTVDESAQELVVTQDGWSFVADTLEVLGK